MPTRPRGALAHTRYALSLLRPPDRTAVGLALLVILPGCASAGAGIVDGAITRLDQRQAAIVQIEQALADSLATYLGRQLELEVLRKADSTWSGMSTTMLGAFGQVFDSATVAVDSELNRAIRRTLEDNLDYVDARSAALTDSLMAAAAAAVERSFADRLAAIFAVAADSAGYRAMYAMGRGVEQEVQPALVETVATLRAVIREEVRRLILPDPEEVGGEGAFGGRLALWLAIAGLAWLALLNVLHSRALHRLRVRQDRADAERAEARSG